MMARRASRKELESLIERINELGAKQKMELFLRTKALDYLLAGGVEVGMAAAIVFVDTLSRLKAKKEERLSNATH